MTENMPDWIVPDWDAPAKVGALITTRQGGVSQAPYDSLNLGDHVGDDPEAVRRNRAILRAHIPVESLWLRQVHGYRVVDAGRAAENLEADGSVARTAGVACAVMTADCLPLLFCDRAGTVVAAAHAGWRGLLNGVIEATIQAMEVEPGFILAYLGPAIGPRAFEVGDEVRQAFTDVDPAAGEAFLPHPERPEKWLADIYRLARQRLAKLGVTAVHGGNYCTYEDSKRFFSYRRDGTTGRMASLIWLQG